MFIANKRTQGVSCYNNRPTRKIIRQSLIPVKQMGIA